MITEPMEAAGGRTGVDLLMWMIYGWAEGTQARPW